MAKLKKIMMQNDFLTETVDEELENASTTETFSTDYTADKLNELYNEFDSITLDNSSIDSLTKRNVETAKLSARAKLYITTGFVITAMLLFLMIYNFFVISKMQNSIDILQDDLTYQEYQVSEKARKVSELTDDAILKQKLTDMGYAEVSSNDVVVINSGVSNYVALEGETNWFDALCEFVASVFGG